MTPTTAAVTPNSAIETGKDTARDPAQDLGGRFAALTVHEPSESFLEKSRDASHEGPKPAQYDAASYEAELPTTSDDIYFAFNTLIKDLHQIRASIQWVWSGHGTHNFDFGAAAVTTNTAVSLARGLIEEVEPILAKYDGGFNRLLRMGFAHDCLKRGMTLDQVWSDGVVTGKQDANYDSYDSAVGCYFIPLTTFEIVSERIPNGVVVLADSPRGEYNDATPSWASMSNKQKFEKDSMILTQHVTDLLAVALLVPDFEVEHEFLRGMRILSKERKAPFTLLFAAQVFLDIHHELGAPAAQKIFVAMTDEVRSMDESVAGYLELHQNIKHRNWTLEWDESLQGVRSRIELNAKGPAYQAKVKLYKEGGLNVLPSDKEKDCIWILSPVLSGLYLSTLRLQVHNLGLDFANAWQSIMHCAHIYNLLGLENTWIDMNMAIFLLSESNFWVGEGRPKTIDDCFEKFYLQNGNTAAAFAPNRRRTHTNNSRGRVRIIEHAMPVSTVFAKAQVGIGTEIAWTPQLLEDIVGSSAFAEEATSDGKATSMAGLRDPQQLRAKERLRQQKAKDKASGKNTNVELVAPEKLILALYPRLFTESLEMTFPIFLLHCQCWKVMRALRDACEPILRDRPYAYRSLTREVDVAWVIWCIFNAVFGLDKSGHRIEPDSRVLNVARATCEKLLLGDESAKATKFLFRFKKFGIEKDEGAG
ncbi:hypothetical protein NCS52_00946000 [Fusarium sp. LHS14.1]|nr:hypothetical protein NCS52_00946000 [Fusarium sp. LHS14.1]